MAWPTWIYYPLFREPPAWVTELVAVVTAQQGISTEHAKTGLSSDKVLAQLAPGLAALHYDVETTKSAANKIRRPVLFSDNGESGLEFQIDAFHDELGVVVEVEAGRGARGNATYRDLIRAGLIVNAKFLALLVPLAYRHNLGEKEATVHAYKDARDLLNAIYASRRFTLPYEGVLLIGY